ncbi:hypothetical protein I4U23_010543 [Adineta vaga]|nr:hypothetical protein I4U23_010543 [Adineta vaga]
MMIFSSLLIYFIIILNFYSIESRHFLGGTISWKVINNKNLTNSTVPVVFTQSYQWKEAATYCSQSLIYVYPPLPSNPDILQCVSSVNSCGGYNTVSTQGYCTDSSTVADTRASQIFHTENITIGSQFCIAFQNMYWMTLQAPSCTTNCPLTSAKWSIGSCIDLTIRPGGFINTSPVATVISPVKVPKNSVTNIKIPVLDVDNDIVKCRWAMNTAILDECGDVCGTIFGSHLDNNNCILTFNSTGKTVGDFYAATLMIEDFANETSNKSFSSIPIQFLIEIVDVPLCPSKPTISLNLSECVAIQVGIEFNFTVIISQGCPNTPILDLVTLSPLKMSKSSLIRIGASNQWTVSHKWIPMMEQIGSQIYCAMAIDNVDVTSDQYCVTFTVLVKRTTSTSTSSSTSTTTTATTSTSTTSIIITVLVPIESNDDSRLVAIGLTFGILMLSLLFGLCLYCCCCRELCNAFCGKIRRRFRNRTEDIDDNYNWNETFTDNSSERRNVPNSSTDYRQLYINERNNSQMNYRPFSPAESSFRSILSPTVCGLPSDYVSRTRTRTSFNSTNHGSILVQAYITQESQKSIDL